MKTYIINFDPLVTPQNKVCDFLDKKKFVLNWLGLFSGTILIVSENPITEIRQELQKKFKEMQFLINESSPIYLDGNLVPKAWNLLLWPRITGIAELLEDEALHEALRKQGTSVGKELQQLLERFDKNLLESQRSS